MGRGFSICRLVMLLARYLSSVPERLGLWVRSNQSSSLANKSVLKSEQSHISLCQLSSKCGLCLVFLRSDLAVLSLLDSNPWAQDSLASAFRPAGTTVVPHCAR